MNAKEMQDLTKDLATIRGIARKLRAQSGIPVVESCARWCEMYSHVALWSLGAEDSFRFMDTAPQGEEK